MLTSPLLVAIILVLLVAGLVIYGNSRVLTLRHVVRSRQKLNAFDFDAALLKMSEEDFNSVRSLIDPAKWKKKLKLVVSYTTPAGKSTTTRSKTYGRGEIPAIVAKLEDLFSEWSVKIPKLNQIYREELEAGRELNDGLPNIYCYRLLDSPRHAGLIKVGYAKGSPMKRIKDQFKTAAHLTVKYEIVFIMPAVTHSGETFMDHAVHRVLKKALVPNPMGEWFACSPEEAAEAVRALQANEA